MRGASTGQDPSPQAPDSAGTAPMNPSERLETSGMFWRICPHRAHSLPVPPIPLGRSLIHDHPLGPESTPDQKASDAAQVQQSAEGASSQVSSSIASASNPPAAEGADAPRKNHLLIPIPSRRSSKTDKQSTAEKTEESAQEAPARRGSRVSILKAHRDRSRASSRRSRQDVANVEKSQGSATPTTPEMNGPPPSQKKSKFLSFLSCCSSSGADGDDDAVLPAKKSTQQQPASNRLPTPDKAEAQTGDSSTAESRDPAYFDNEKANLTSGDQRKTEEVASSQTEIRGEESSLAAGQSESLEVSTTDKDHQTSSINTSTMANGTIPESKAEEASSNGEEPPQSTDEPAPIDPISKQPAGDSEEHTHEEVVQQSPQATVVLPPPPPPPIAPEVPSAPENHDQQWLLPPAVAPLKGRKCLVLDLDETLVHSSFKVRFSLMT